MAYTSDEIVTFLNRSDKHKLGDGGSCVVYRCFLRGELVALKVLRYVELRATGTGQVPLAMSLDWHWHGEWCRTLLVRFCLKKITQPECDHDDHKVVKLLEACLTCVQWHWQ